MSNVDPHKNHVDDNSLYGNQMPFHPVIMAHTFENPKGLSSDYTKQPMMAHVCFIRLNLLC